MIHDQLDNFIENHCDGDLERFIEILSHINSDRGLALIARLYGLSPSNLSRRLKRFTRVTFTDEVWSYLEDLQTIKKSVIERQDMKISSERRVFHIKSR